MATGLDICSKIAQSNKIAAHMKGLRIQDGKLFATNMINTIQCDRDALKGLDCLVEPGAFVAAWKAIRKPEIVQKGLALTLQETDGKSKVKVDLALLPTDNYKSEIGKKHEGKEVEPTGFLGAVKRLLPFLKIADNQIWVIGKHLYVTDSVFLVRTPSDCDIPLTDRPLTITREFAELLQSVEDKPVKMLFTEDLITVVFERCWLESARFNPTIPGDLAHLFSGKDYDAIQFEPLPDEVNHSLKNMLNFADKKDNVTFSPMGISLMKAGVASWSIAHPMSDMLISSEALRTVLGLGGVELSFQDQWKLAFRTVDLEGFWASKMAAARQDVPVADEPSEPEVEEAKEPEFDLDLV